jgi:DNA polymerase V
MLEAHNILTAYDLSKANESWVKAKMSVIGQRMLYELRGISCLSLELINEPKKNICTSRSFGIMLTDKAPLSEAIANFAAACAFKLRKQHSVANFIQVFVTTNPFAKNEKQYFNSITITLPVADSDSRIIIKNALLGLQKIYRDGFKYKKAGVIVSGIIPEDEYQLALFSPNPDNNARRVMQVLDAINHSNGRTS